MSTSKSQPTIWAVRGGSIGQADSIFLNQGLLALGWRSVGDMNTLTELRPEFKKKMIEAHSDFPLRTCQVWAGQVYRFVVEMKDGDLVIYPSKVDRLIHIGTVTGPYFRDVAVHHEYCTLRKVAWIKTVPRSVFSGGALSEINSSLTLLMIKNHPEEILTQAQAQPSR